MYFAKGIFHSKPDKNYNVVCKKIVIQTGTQVIGFFNFDSSRYCDMEH